MWILRSGDTYVGKSVADENPNPTELRCARLLRVICAVTGYVHYVEAILDAAAASQERKDGKNG